MMIGKPVPETVGIHRARIDSVDLNAFLFPISASAFMKAKLAPITVAPTM